VKPSLALIALLASCAPNFVEPSRVLARELPENREPLLERRHTFFANDLQRPHRDWSELLYADGRIIPHGRDLQWYANGKPEWEREFDHGEATGHWLSWWENGNPRSDATFGGAELKPQRWWYENGQLSSEGLALSGAKDGAWTEWYQSGVKSAAGSYRLGKKEGPWTFWNEDGSPKESVVYRDDLRVGPAVPKSAPEEHP
jgi:hypothetical protein